jgi:hypothetical protein
MSTFDRDTGGHLDTMYLLPLTLVPANTLIVTYDGGAQEPLAGRQWPGQIAARRCEDLLSPQSPVTGGFDLVILHGTLDHVRLRYGGDAELALLQAAIKLLAPGGVVAGIRVNRLQLNRAGKSVLPTFGISARTCAKQLSCAGLGRPSVFYALPTADTPWFIASSDRALARRHFEDALQRRRGEYSVVDYILRKFLIVSGTYRHLAGALFFWGTV